MFERYNDLARRILALAQEEARLLKHDHIGTQHLLLGMIHTEQGIAHDALTRFDLDLLKVREEILKITPEGEEVLKGHIPFTIRSKRSLEYSLRESLALGDGFIGTEHVLLGVLRQVQDNGEPSVASRVLTGLGVNLAVLRGTVVGMRRQSPSASSEAVFAQAQLGIHPIELAQIRAWISSTSATMSSDSELTHIAESLEDYARAIREMVGLRSEERQEDQEQQVT